jgi:hypothetical protein
VDVKDMSDWDRGYDKGYLAAMLRIIKIISREYEMKEPAHVIVAKIALQATTDSVELYQKESAR